MGLVMVANGKSYEIKCSDPIEWEDIKSLHARSDVLDFVDSLCCLSYKFYRWFWSWSIQDTRSMVFEPFNTRKIAKVSISVDRVVMSLTARRCTVIDSSWSSAIQ